MKNNRKKNIVFGFIIIAQSIGCTKDPKTSVPLTEKKAVVTTIAGDGTDGYANGPALSAEFESPVDIAVGADGTLYVADYNNHRIRKIAGGEVTSFAGDGTFGIANGNGGFAKFEDPFRITAGAGGNLYLLDMVDSRIRKITPSADVSFYAGTATAGFLDTAALMAQFQVNASGIAADADGNIYIGDTFNQRIRKISTGGQVSTKAGNGTPGFRNDDSGNAEFWFPAGTAFDPQGNLYVADAGNYRIRKITPAGVVSTFAGSGVPGEADGDAATAQFKSINDMVSDSHGNLFVIDQQRIRRITPNGFVNTIAGSVNGYADGDGDQAKFGYPEGVGIDAQGNIYVADAGNNRIRKISFQ